MSKKILLVEDDQSFGYILKEYLGLKGYEVIWETNGTSFNETLEKNTFVLAILDINLPGQNGFELSKTLTNKYPLLPFIFLSARDMKIDQLKGYKLGATEYVTKPIDEELFLAKIEAILSRSSVTKTTVITYKKVELDTHNSSLKVRGETINLSNRECALLSDLMREPLKLLERNLLLERHWDSTDEFSRNSMDVFISKLRKYLSTSDVEIRNVHGKGFILE